LSLRHQQPLLGLGPPQVALPLKTARAMGFDLPASVRARADEVIE